ncbi:MAG: acetate uptake transporter [Clostridiales bacterium]|jgi:succinate-acetate transporter protein|nr:acetate uptake transporter [Clostridiales bacterium]
MQNQPTQNVRIITADPSAIGLLGLAIVTLVASSQKLGITQDVSLIIPWALFLGASAQLIASFGDAKLGNTFGMTAFGAYGLFWLGVAMTWLIQNGVFGETLAATADVKELGFAFIGYLIFTLFMTYVAASIHKVMFFIFLAIDFLFIGLAVNALVPGSLGHWGHWLAAFAELTISMLAFYGCAAAVMSCHFGRTVLPVGKPFIKR